MGTFSGEFFTTDTARKAYATGLQLFGYTPIEETIPDPASKLSADFRAAVNGALDLLDGGTNFLAQRVDFDRSDVDAALKAFQGSVHAMFASDFEYTDAVGPMMDALGKLTTAIEPLTAEFDAAATKYLSDVALTRRNDLPEAQKRAKAWTDALQSRLGEFEIAGRNATVAAAVVLEHESVAFNEPVDTMWARVHLADTTDRLHERVGDLPDALKLRASDDDLSAYLGLASEGVEKVTLGQGSDDVLAQFEKDAAAIQDRAAAHLDPAAFVQACGRLDELIYQLGKEITRAAAEKPPADPDEVTASENAIATSMVLCEGVRAVLDMKRGGPRTAREDDEQELGTDAYDAAVKSAREDRDSLARMADTEARRDADSAGTADPDRDRR